jgi:hypothetical protein
MDRAFLRAKLHHLGVSRAAAYYSVRALRALGLPEAYRLLRLTPEESRAVPVRVARLECAHLSPERLRCAAEDSRSGLSPEQLRGALARGEECYGAFVGPVLASHAWYPGGTAHLRGDLFVNVGPEWSYTRWSYTRPEFRGLGLHAAVKAVALADVSRKGKRGILSLVAITNFESLRGNARAGCRSVGLVVVARVGGLQLAWRSAGCRSCGLVVAVHPPDAGERCGPAAPVPGGRGGR